MVNYRQYLVCVGNIGTGVRVHIFLFPYIKKILGHIYYIAMDEISPSG
jgi:hypothetical protein